MSIICERFLLGALVIWTCYGKVFSELPPINGSTYNGVFPQGWHGSGPWATVDYKSNKPKFGTNPNHLALRMSNAGEWWIGVETGIQVQANKTYTFTVLIGGRNVGWLKPVTAPPGNVYVVIGSDDDGSGELGIATFVPGTDFGWQTVAQTWTAPADMSVFPMIKGKNGGDIFIAGASFEEMSSPYEFPTITQPLPSKGVYDISHCIIQSNGTGIYYPGETISWSILPGARYHGLGILYSIVNEVGETIRSPEPVPIGGTVYVTTSERGYYELRIHDNLSSVGELKAKSGAAIIGSLSTWAWVSNPFGLEHGLEPYLARLGFTWTRPLYYHIVTGSHTQFSTVPEYDLLWRHHLSQNTLKCPQLNTVEVWNEPVNELCGSNVGCRSAFPWDDFVSTVDKSQNGIRGFNPTTKIAVNLEHLNQFEHFNDVKGGRNLYQIAALHPYTRQIFEPPYDNYGPERADLVSLLHNYTNHMPEKELWSTEYGWPTYIDLNHPNGPCRPKWSVPELEQAQYIARSTLIQLGLHLKRVMPYRPHDVPGDGALTGSFGLARSDGTPKPALIAYSMIAQTINDLPYVGWFELGNNSVALVFGTNVKTTLAIWSINENLSTSITLPTGEKKKVEIFGKTTDYASQITSIPYILGRTPVLFHCQSGYGSVIDAIQVSTGKSIHWGRISSGTLAQLDDPNGYDSDGVGYCQ